MSIPRKVNGEDAFKRGKKKVSKYEKWARKIFGCSIKSTFFYCICAANIILVSREEGIRIWKGINEKKNFPLYLESFFKLLPLLPPRHFLTPFIISYGSEFFGRQTIALVVNLITMAKILAHHAEER